MPESLTVLSPHRDDSVFSVALIMRRAIALAWRVRVLSFFTVSNYAPFTTVAAQAHITELRKREDLDALHAISPAIEEHSLQLLDAPLRLHLSLDQIMQREAIAVVSDDEVTMLSRSIKAYVRDDYVLAPLALGNHVDHQVIHRAARDAVTPDRLAFYEDLPYAAWARDEEILSRAQGLIPEIVREDDAIETKYRLASVYTSQIEVQEARRIAAFSNSYGGGERYWSSGGWPSLT